MQQLYFDCIGEGTYASPLLLTNEQDDFDIAQPFNIIIRTNKQLEFGKEVYLQILGTDTIYLLAVLRASVVSSIRYDAINAVKLTMLGTTVNNTVDGLYKFEQHLGIYYIVKTQIFEDSAAYTTSKIITEIADRKAADAALDTAKANVGHNHDTEYADINYDNSVSGLIAATTKTAIDEVALIAKTACINITYAELLALKTANAMQAGMFYRITDYVTTTSQVNTQSAMHQFDIIVFALTTTELAEQAYAALHDGDTYFANCKLNMWTLKYSLLNDASRFMWADTLNGKGIIYYMRDEHGNSACYDFKNIQYKRYKLTAVSDNFLNTILFASTTQPLYYGMHTITDAAKPANATLSDFIWVYTFSACSYEQPELFIDGSLLQRENYMTSANYDVFANNIISECKYATYNNNGADIIVLRLNNIVIYGRFNEALTGVGTKPLVECSFANTFDSNCYDMTLGYCCIANIFGHMNYGNILCRLCKDNVFAIECYDNMLGHGCIGNVFDNACHDNIFYMSAEYNKFDANCYSNKIGQASVCNSFGKNCTANISSAISSSFSFNTIGAGSHSNSFGNRFSQNQLGEGCFDNAFTGNDIYANIFGDICSYLKCSTGLVKGIVVDSFFTGPGTKFELYDSAVSNKNYTINYKTSVSGRRLMLWATDTGVMTGKYKTDMNDTVWKSL